MDRHAGSARAELFDLALARALTYLRRARVVELSDADAVRRALEVWYLKTRFAYRVPLAEVVRALGSHPPGDEDLHWVGGPTGGWQR